MVTCKYLAVGPHLFETGPKGGLTNLTSLYTYRVDAWAWSPDDKTIAASLYDVGSKTLNMYIVPIATDSLMRVNRGEVGAQVWSWITVP